MIIFLLIFLSQTSFKYNLKYEFHIEYYNPNDTLIRYRGFINRFSLLPEIKVYGIPFNLNINFDSYKGKFVGKLKSLSLNFSLYNYRKNFGLLLSPLFLFTSFNIGRFSLLNTDLTFKGFYTDGLSFGYRLFFINIYYAGGELKRDVSSNDTIQFYNRKFNLFKLGIGREEGNNFSVTYAHFYDTGYKSSDTSKAPPSENRVVSTFLKLKVKKFLNETEVSFSITTPDLFSQKIVSEELPGFVIKFFKPRISSYSDIAVINKTLFTIGKIKTGVDIKYIGPGYNSFGVYNLKNDVFSLNSHIEGSFFENKLKQRIFYIKRFDNLEAIKRKRTEILTIGTGTFIFIPGFPYINLNFSNTRTKGSLYSELNFFSFGSGYNYSLSKFFLSTSLILSYQKESYNNYSSFNFIANQGVGFKRINLNLGVGISEIYNIDKEKIKSLSISLSYPIWKFNIRNSIGYEFLKDNDRNDISLNISSNLSSFLKLSFYFRYSNVKNRREVNSGILISGFLF